MDTQMIGFIKDTLTRIENSVGKVSEKLDTYSESCTKERIDFEHRIKYLEKVKEKTDKIKNSITTSVFHLVEKVAIYIIITYVIGKEVVAHF